MSDQQDLHRRLERLNRLRKLGVRRGVRDLPAVPAATRPFHAAATPAAQAVQLPASSFQLPASSILPGEEVHTPFGPAWVRTARYPLAERPDLAEWLTVQPAALAALDRNDALLRLEPAKVAFIDTETTGLSLGAGTYTFLIGVGTFEDETPSSSASSSCATRPRSAPSSTWSRRRWDAAPASSASTAAASTCR